VSFVGSSVTEELRILSETRMFITTLTKAWPYPKQTRHPFQVGSKSGSFLKFPVSRVGTHSACPKCFECSQVFKAVGWTTNVPFFDTSDISFSATHPHFLPAPRPPPPKKSLSKNYRSPLLRRYLCVLCGSENKQRLFHCTALTDWFL
jgi:hypothetical protein